MKTRKIVRTLLLVILLVIVLAGIGFVIWASTPLGPSPEALQALQGNDAVLVQEHPNWIIFIPRNGELRTGFIFYPGGRVDARSYAPLLRPLAEKGTLVVLARMPLNLAVFAPGRAGAVLAAYPQVQRWVIGGHSLGGAMAASYVYSHPGQMAGLALWAAYPAGNNSLAGANVRVISIYATLDGLATPQKIMQSKALLPGDAQFVAVEGGNHAQFGSYGPQPGDNLATISAAAQAGLVDDAMIIFLAGLEN